jgi:hypothetical protein
VLLATAALTNSTQAQYYAPAYVLHPAGSIAA